MKTLKLAAGLAALALASTASADIIYSDWDTNEGGSGNYILTVVLNGSGDFDVELTVDPWNAEALGLFIDLGDVDLTDTTISNIVPANEVSVFDTDTTSDNCGQGCNLQGLDYGILPPDGEWEWVLSLGAQGFDGIQTFSFTLAGNGLTEADWGLVGIRAQNYCDPGQLLPDGNCDGSDKSFGSGGPPDFDVAEPGTLALLGLGLLGMGAVRRRRQSV